MRAVDARNEPASEKRELDRLGRGRHRWWSTPFNHIARGAAMASAVGPMNIGVDFADAAFAR